MSETITPCCGKPFSAEGRIVPQLRCESEERHAGTHQAMHEGKRLLWADNRCDAEVWRSAVDVAAATVQLTDGSEGEE